MYAHGINNSVPQNREHHGSKSLGLWISLNIISLCLGFFSLYPHFGNSTIPEANMFNFPSNLEPKVPLESRSKNQGFVCVRKQRGEGERQRIKALPCSNSYTSHWMFYTFFSDIINNVVLLENN